MDDRLIQRTRYVLRSRTRRVQALPEALFVLSCVQYLTWLDDHPVLGPALSRLDRIDADFMNHIPSIVHDTLGEQRAYDPGFYSAQSTQEHAALCFATVQACASLSEEPKSAHTFVLRNLAEYLTGEDPPTLAEAVEAIRDVAVDGLYEYLDERLDARNVLFGLLSKYKQRSEWFHRSRLRSVADDGLEGRAGERALALDLYGYILDQGVEFYIEPVSASGEADLILREPEGRYIVIDAKYVPPDAPRSKIKEQLSRGFNQVSRYCFDFDEPEGFLVVYHRHTKKLRLELEESDGPEFLHVGGKVVYFLSVNIADLPSASKEGKSQSFVFRQHELVEAGSEV